MAKLCNKCGKIKEMEEFGLDKNSPDGRRYECKKCRSLHEEHLYHKSKDRYQKRIKEYKDKNREKVRACGRKYYQDNKQKYSDYKRDNIDRVRIWAARHRDKFKKKYPDYYKEYFCKRRKIDYTFRITCNLRARLNSALHGRNKSNRTKEIIGCPIGNLMRHLESKFLPGMSWDNYGEWHIDHIIPCSTFDLSNEEEQKKCFNFSNLQPLWATDNLRKGNKVIV